VSKPGKGLISTSRVELLNITTMNLLMKDAGNLPPGLLAAARRHAVNLHGVISELAVLIDTQKMDEGDLADLSAYLISLDALLDSLKEQAAMVGSPELETTYKDAGNTLRAFVQRLKSGDAAFAEVFEGITGTEV